MLLRGWPPTVWPVTCRVVWWWPECTAESGQEFDQFLGLREESPGDVQAGVREFFGVRGLAGLLTAGGAAESEPGPESVAACLLVEIYPEVRRFKARQVAEHRPLADLQFPGDGGGVPRTPAAGNQLENAEDAAEAFGLAGPPVGVGSSLASHGGDRRSAELVGTWVVLASHYRRRRRHPWVSPLTRIPEPCSPPAERTLTEMTGGRRTCGSGRRRVGRRGGVPGR